jgi:hypothetical protein
MHNQEKEKDIGRRIRGFTILIAIVFAGVLAAFIGSRLSNESLAVLAGAVCGVGAAIPTSLLIVAITLRRQQDDHQPQTPSQSYPPVVVVNPGEMRQRLQPQVENLPRQRRWEETVIGD